MNESPIIACSIGNHSRCCWTKCCQQLDESWIIFTRTSSRKFAKLMSRKFCRAIYALDIWGSPVRTARMLAIYNRCTPCVVSYTQHMLGFLQMRALLTEVSHDSWNNFTDFPYSAGKNIKILSSRWWRSLLATSAVWIADTYVYLHRWALRPMHSAFLSAKL